MDPLKFLPTLQRFLLPQIQLFLLVRVELLISGFGFESTNSFLELPSCLTSFEISFPFSTAKDLDKTPESGDGVQFLDEIS